MSPDLLVSWGVSALVPHLLEYLKRKPWAPIVAPHAPTLNRVTGIVVAVLTSLGISWSYDAVAGELVIRGLTLGSVVTLALRVASAWVVQEISYRQWVDQGRPR